MPTVASTATAAIIALSWAGLPAQAQATPEGGSIVLEGHVGYNDTPGAIGLALVYDPGGRISAGLGLGIAALRIDTLPPLSVFGRLRLLRRGPFALSVGATMSREQHTTERSYTPPYGTSTTSFGESMVWAWQPAYRATGTLAAEVANRRWSFRLEAGLGYLLNDPTCTYGGSGIRFTGDCQSPEIPDAYHFAVAPGRLLPSLTMVVGYRFGVDDSPAPAGAAGIEYRSPSQAFRLSVLSTLLPLLAGAALLGASVSNDDNVPFAIGGVASLVLGLSFGPSIGYAYAGEHLRGWGAGGLRLAGIGIASLAVLYSVLSTACDECHETTTSRMEVRFGLGLFGAVLISTTYDVLTSPRAALRANARSGVTNLGVVPLVLAGNASTQTGLALAGQF